VLFSCSDENQGIKPNFFYKIVIILVFIVNNDKDPDLDPAGKSDKSSDSRIRFPSRDA
jgi:hypothetical protein